MPKRIYTKTVRWYSVVFACLAVLVFCVSLSACVFTKTSSYEEKYYMVYAIAATQAKADTLQQEFQACQGVDCIVEKAGYGFMVVGNVTTNKQEALQLTKHYSFIVHMQSVAPQVLQIRAKNGKEANWQETFLVFLTQVYETYVEWSQEALKKEVVQKFWQNTYVFQQSWLHQIKNAQSFEGFSSLVEKQIENVKQVYNASKVAHKAQDKAYQLEEILSLLLAYLQEV